MGSIWPFLFAKGRIVEKKKTHLDHGERQSRGSYCYGFENNGDDVYHICNNAEILEQKRVHLGNGAYREERANDFDGNHLFCNEAKMEHNSFYPDIHDADHISMCQMC